MSHAENLLALDEVIQPAVHPGLNREVETERAAIRTHYLELVAEGLMSQAAAKKLQADRAQQFDNFRSSQRFSGGLPPRAFSQYRLGKIRSQ